MEESVSSIWLLHSTNYARFCTSCRRIKTLQNNASADKYRIDIYAYKKVKVVPVLNAMKTCGGVFLTSALVGRRIFTPRSLYLRGTHWTGGRVGPRTGLDDVKNRKYLTLPGLELRPLGHQAHSQSLYRLPYTRMYTVYYLFLD
jgi:hypothetical protein